MRFARALALALALAIAASAAGCGSGSKALPGDTIPGKTLTIYASVPMNGASRLDSIAVVSGQKLALAQVHNRIGRFRIVFRPLDDSTPQRGHWDPGQTTVNARSALQDKTTIGYLGDLNSGASAISIPLLNRLGIPQISPTNTAVGLTSSGGAASPGEPYKYYPTGERTYVRIVPNDTVQAAAQVKLQKREGCTRTYVLDDGEVDGLDTAMSFTLAAQRGGLPVVGVQSFDPRAADYLALAAGVAQTRPDCVLISAIIDSNAVLVTKQIAAALPQARIFGAAGLGETSFSDPAQGGIPTDLAARVLITIPTLGPSLYPTPGRAFYASYARIYGLAQPAAIYGYESMSLLLSAIARATHDGTKPARRSKVVSELFATRHRHSVLGTYSITADGDTTLRRYGVYGVQDGQLVFVTAITA
jgi:branched-chain amino acid transport system substrate-binding protein